MIMRAFFRIILITLLSTFFACQSIGAQANPTVTTIYSLEQIDQMHRDHRMAHPRNAYPPQNISAKFAKDFSNVRDVDWEKSNIFYEVEFEISRMDYDAYYDMEGNLVMYKCEINESDLPAVVRNAALAKHPNFKFDDVDKVVKGSQTFYNVKLEKGKLEVKIVMQHDGTIISEYFD